MTIDEFRALVKASTSAPWAYRVTDGHPLKANIHQDSEWPGDKVAGYALLNDAALIAALRNHADLFLELWEAAEELCNDGALADRDWALARVLAKLDGEKGSRSER